MEEQAVHLGEPREDTREQHAKGVASERGTRALIADLFARRKWKAC